MGGCISFSLIYIANQTPSHRDNTTLPIYFNLNVRFCIFSIHTQRNKKDIGMAHKKKRGDTKINNTIFIGGDEQFFVCALKKKHYTYITLLAFLKNDTPMIISENIFKLKFSVFFVYTCWQ